MRLTHAAPLLLATSTFLLACDGTSPRSPLSPEAPELASVVAPSTLTATAVSPTEIDLAWQTNKAQLDGIEVARSSAGPAGAYTLLASIDASARSYPDRWLLGSTQYCYELRSYRISGTKTSYSSYGSPACATTLPPPVAAPTGVRVVPMPLMYPGRDTSALQVTWTDASSNEDGFSVERATTAAGPWTQAATTGANVTSVSQIGAREQLICFRVTAFDSAGSSNPSPAGCTAPPANPTNLTATSAARAIELAWVDNSAVEDGYRVSRADASAIWTVIATLTANTTSYSDGGAAADVYYSYRVQALKDGGASDYSDRASAVIATTRPKAPLGFGVGYCSGVNCGSFGIKVDAWWTDASTNEAGFRLEKSADSVSGWTTVASVPTNTSEYLDWASSPLSACYRVIAFNAVGDSDPSNINCIGDGEAPTNLVATAVDSQSVALSWTDNAVYETGYTVLRSTSIDGSFDPVAFLDANTTTYRDTTLESGHTYWYLVSVAYSYYDGSGYFGEDLSNYASATTILPAGAAQTATTRIAAPWGPLGIHVRPSTTRRIGGPVLPTSRMQRPRVGAPQPRRPEVEPQASRQPPDAS